MWRTLAHHVPKWALLELAADGALCFIVVWFALRGVAAAPHAPQGVAEAFFSAAVCAVGMALLNALFGLYRPAVTPVGLVAAVIRSLVALAIGAVVVYLSLDPGHHRDFAIEVAGSFAVFTGVGVIGVRGLGHLWRGSRIAARRVIIVGTGQEAVDAMRELNATTMVRHDVVGFYPAACDESVAEEIAMLGASVFSSADSLAALVRRHRVTEVIVAVREQRNGSVPMAQLLDCRTHGVRIVSLAGFFERSHGEVHIASLKASWLVYGGGFVQGPVRTAIKRAFDIVVSLLLLAVFAPVMLLTAIAIKLDSAGPLIYRQRRIGLHGRPFTCLKFRSMTVDAEKDGVARWATSHDARVTRVGHLIRSMRIDELPQLISVLCGEMSLVGPRPERPAFVQQLRQEIQFYDVRHSVKPGLTGWAQIRFSYGSSVADARRKHQFDLYYVKHHTLLLDLLILIETVSVVLFREGAR